jgi:two-component sensor histidine kinase
LGDHLRDLSTIDAMTAKAAEIVGRTLNASRAGYGELDSTGQFITIPDDWALPGEVRLIGRHRFADYGTVGSGLQRGDTLVVANVETDTRTADHAKPFRAINVHAMLNVPVRERGRTVGVFFVHNPTVREWGPEEVAFARNVADRVQVGIGRLRAEEQQATLNHEISHRMKNTLAMVQAIATQTMRNAVDLDAARSALAARLVALGKAHDLLLSGTRESASIGTILRGALAIHEDAQANRLRLDGPPVQVGARAALSLALIVHELAINAAKYGALSVAGGHVRVAWSIDTTGPEPIVRLCWIERDGPPVTAPTNRGFGSRLIERGLAGAFGGEANLTYEPAGVVCELTAPLAAIEADE